MITAKLGDYFDWEGQIVKVEWINPGEKSIGFSITKKHKCKSCGEETEYKGHHDIIESSPCFQQTAKPLQTIKT